MICKVTLNQPCHSVINSGQNYIVESNPGSTLQVSFKNLSSIRTAQINITKGNQIEEPVNLQLSQVTTKEYLMGKFHSITFSNLSQDAEVEITVNKIYTSPSVQVQYNENIRLYMEENKGYIISASQERVADVGPKEYFPQFSTLQSPIDLQLSGGMGGIKDGDTLRIQTTEAFVGEYRVLGAWTTPALYYYNGSYKQQEWTIRKRDNSDPIVHYGDQVYFVNNYWEQWLCIQNNGRWLTTKKDANIYWLIDK